MNLVPDSQLLTLTLIEERGTRDGEEDEQPLPQNRKKKKNEKRF
jgi:hypothetical protein